ncbi:bifunctional DNA primase/polymerase [Caballeronia sp. GAWG1-5s-s]|uniref:bifunctional DNA primase/polymerase n=1 Tax=Caballeronia sp. GAWG1-5s-s TaxID=2921743 RepID=UPI002027B8C7|nr:bifunctional DNA primase/polymerase [Caballeronia sp. GAWG1-5s-s]
MVSNQEYRDGASRRQLEPGTRLDCALAYAAQGYYVLPLEPNGKTPLTRHGVKDATRDPAKIAEWWRTCPEANIGINCSASGLAVVDIDRHAGKANGFDTLAALEAEHGPLCSPVVVKTGSGGEHRYYRVPGGAQLPGKLGPGIDLKHNNGYVVAPPSVHPNGTAYEWMPGASLLDAPPLPLLPDWVHAPCAEHSNAPMDVSDRLPTEIARACSALFSLDAGCDRDAWIRRAMAAKDAGVSFGAFNEWSSLGANYEGEDDCRAAWDSFRDDKADRVTAATLFHQAQKAGWNDPAKVRIAPEVDAGRYRLLSADDLLNAPPLSWLVRGVLPASGLAALYGPSGSGKSFLALDLCAAVAGGAEWFERRVTAAPVTYLCLEGEAGLSKRTHAWREHYGRALPDRMAFITQSFDLRNEADVDDLCAAVSEAGLRDGLLVIDTLNRAAPGADENASTDMGALIEACKAIQRAVGGVVLAVHHTGKDAAKGLRGHSSLFAALDAGIEVRRDGERREWSVAKSKDDADGARNAFRLQLVELGEDADGELETSCVVEADEAPAQSARRVLKGATQKLVHDGMQLLLLTSEHKGEGGAPVDRACVRKDDAVTALAGDMTCEIRRRKPEARRALDSLIAAGLYIEPEGWVWEN